MSVEVSPMNFLQPWKVRSIEILPNQRGAEVTFSVEGRDPIRFRTRRFGVGRRGAKAAALAKFAAQAGFGEVAVLYQYLVGLPKDMVGIVLSENMLTALMRPQGSPKSPCLGTHEAAA